LPKPIPESRGGKRKEGRKERTNLKRIRLGGFMEWVLWGGSGYRTLNRKATQELLTKDTRPAVERQVRLGKETEDMGTGH